MPSFPALLHVPLETVAVIPGLVPGIHLSAFSGVH
jgi:hypothetical protein